MKCYKCSHFVVCGKYEYDEDRKNCKDFEAGIPVNVGDVVYVDSRTLPTDRIDLDDIPKCFKAKVISIRRNSKGWFFKVGVCTYWLESVFDQECGNYDCGMYKQKYFSYPNGAIGKTVFLSRVQAEIELGGDGYEPRDNAR